MKTQFTSTCLSVFLIFGATFAQDNTLPATGNVGIGTLNPDSKLNVNGNMYSNWDQFKRCVWAGVGVELSFGGNKKVEE